jgi:hypothetical protein
MKERKCSGKGWKDLDGISVYNSVMRPRSSEHFTGSVS